MKSTRLTLFSLLLLIGVCAPLARAQSGKPPSKISFQGFLTDGNGTPLGNTDPTNATVYFRIYSHFNSNETKHKKWAEEQVITIDKGHFSVVLGEGSPTGLANDGAFSDDLSGLFNGSDAAERYIGIQVKGQTEVAPRIQFFTAPFSFLAQNANQLVNAAGAPVLAINGDGKIAASTGIETTGSLSAGKGVVSGDLSVSGKVGIGTSTPDAKLTIDEDNTEAGGRMLALRKATDPKKELYLGWNAASDHGAIQAFHHSVGSKPLVLQPSGGSVGIGAVPDTAKLTIATPDAYTGSLLKVASTANPNGFNLILNAVSEYDLVKYSWDLTNSNDSYPNNLVLDRGNVGIGTKTPTAKLTIDEDNTLGGGRMLALRKATDTTKELYLGWDAAGDFGAIQSYQHFAGAKPLILQRSGGNVGIGTATPRAPLEVSGSALYDLTDQYHRFYSMYGGLAIVYANNAEPDATQSHNYSIIASDRIWASEFNAVSDRRIKEIVGHSSSKEDLTLIQKLRVTDYRMVDKVKDGNSVHKGFIAQEVEKVIPEAVSISPGFIPNIFAPALVDQFDTKGKCVTLSLTNSHSLKVGDIIRVFADESTQELTVQSVKSPKSIVIGPLEKSPRQVFVYGQKVSDFRSVNYDRIFTTGISAIQELAKQVEQLKASEARVAELEQKAARVDSLEQKVAALEKLVAQALEASKIPRVTAQGDAPASSVALAAK
jgi:hypothetical protein